MPELPVKEIRRSELHLPEIKRDDIVRSLSEIRLPAIELPTVELRRREDSPTRFDWRSVDLGAAVAGAAALAQAGVKAGRPLFRRSRVTVAAGTIVVVGLVAAAVLATPAVRQRAGATVRRVRDRVDARMSPSDVLELGDDATLDDPNDLPSAGELVTDGTLPAPEMAVDGPTIDGPAADPAMDGPVADVPGADVPIAR
jgi:hypothetical protein